MPEARPGKAPDNRPLAWITWPFSLILPVAFLLLLLTLAFKPDSNVIEIKVTNTDGTPLAGAQVVADSTVYLADNAGTVRLAVDDSARTVEVRHDGYQTMVGELDSGSKREQPVVLEPAGGELASAGSPTTDTPPAVHLSDITSTPTTETTPPATEQPANTPVDASIDIAAEASPSPASAESARATGEIAGVVMGDDGEPVPEAWITDGNAFAFTDADGAFVFPAGEIDPDAELTIYGPGYHEATMPVPTDGEPMAITLETQVIRGIYYNPNITDTPEKLQALIDIANTTEINAIVVDIKEELVFYDTQVQFFRDAGVVSPILDLPTVLQTFKDNNIYTIARLVVFKDSAVAEKYPWLGVQDSVTGDLWRDMNGIAWVNPMLHELWDYNIELALEAADLGFDEIQYDYVRFPTDGDLSRVVYGLPNTQEHREASIEKFLQRSYEALIPTRTKLSADIFGYTVKVEDDLGIGQNMDQLVHHVDYISPMIYPSHWPDGSIPVDGHPNDFPYETTKISMEMAIAQLDGSRKKLRPWLQDFNMPGMMKYGAPEVRAQIDAVEDLGLGGWLIWDPNNWYHEDAFLPETDPQPEIKVTPVATPQSISVGYGTRTRHHNHRNR